MKYCLVSLGCQMNISDSERVSSVLASLGHSPTDVEEDANILGLVACSVRQRATDRAYAKIRKWNAWKNSRNLTTFITGCVLPIDQQRFLDLFDLYFPIDELPKLADMLHGIDATEAGRDLAGGFWSIEPAYESSFEAYVPIQNGCDKFCSFCAVPYTRGREVSRPSGEILNEIESLIERNYKSITLLGQNVNSYGNDRGGRECSFAELLRKIGDLTAQREQETWIYFTSPHPSDMTRDVLHTIAEYPSLGKQIHLPMQSGDDEVLRRMNRNYTIERYRRIVGDIKSTIPEATLFTDIIVGFPGETEAQFERTRAALREFRFNMAYIAMYSPRPGARSERLDDDVPHEEKKHRLHELSKELKAISLQHNTALTGKTIRVLITGLDRKEGYLSARSEGRIIARLPCGNTDLVGTFTNLDVTAASEMSIEGELSERQPSGREPTHASSRSKPVLHDGTTGTLR